MRAGTGQWNIMLKNELPFYLLHYGFIPYGTDDESWALITNFQQNVEVFVHVHQ